MALDVNKYNMTTKLVGDVSAELLKKVGADKLARAYERLSGRPCNCAGRRQALNNIHRAILGKVGMQVARPPQDQSNLPLAPVDELPPRI